MHLKKQKFPRNLLHFNLRNQPKRMLMLTMMMILSLAACQLVMPVTEKPPAGLRPDAPPYAVHGPFGVGYRQAVSGEGTESPLDISIWYPALNPTGAMEKVTYAFELKDGSGPATVYGKALLNATIDVSQGPYPLVIFSHGFGSSAAGYSTLVEHYASYGFIVLAPDHTEQFDPSFGDLWKSLIDRPIDVKQTLDYAEELTVAIKELGSERSRAMSKLITPSTIRLGAMAAVNMAIALSIISGLQVALKRITIMFPPRA